MGRGGEAFRDQGEHYLGPNPPSPTVPSPVQPGDLEAPTGDLVQAPLTSGTTWLGDQAPPTPPAEAGPEV